MRILITLVFDMAPHPVEVQLPDFPTFISVGGMIMRPYYPHLDNDLRNLVLVCSAQDPSKRPTLKWLSDMVGHSISIKTALYYMERRYPLARIETDDNIYQMMTSLFFEADC